MIARKEEGVSSHNINFEYNSLGQLIKQNLASSEVDTTTQYQWDSFGNPVSQSKLKNGELTEQQTDTSDAINHVENNDSAYTNDVIHSEYSDSIAASDSNLTDDTVIQSTTEADRLTLFGDSDFHYDEYGNQTRETGKGIKTHREYNAFNQLSSFNNNGTLTHYDYDPLGRRIAKHTEHGKIDYIWDNDQLIGEYQHGEYTWYINLPNQFHPVALIKQGEVYYYHLDQLNTPRFVTNNAEVVWQNHADVYGYEEPEASIKNSFTQPIRFQGQYFDEESGFHYNRYRYYSPKQQRFINQDPIGLVGGINHYQYAPNPVNWVDPLGLLCKEGEKKLDRMLSNLVSSGGIDEATKNKILEIAIASAVINEPHKSTLKYTPEGAKYRKEHEYDITGLDEENGLIKLNKVSESGKITTEVVSTAQFAEQHIINSERVKLNPDSKPTKYHKRTVGEVEEARKAFPPKRSEYIRKYASDALNDDSHEAHKHFSNREDLEEMAMFGRVPDGYNVHHKKPIFRCDTSEDPNAIENLELLTDEFHTSKNKELHWYEDGEAPYDDNGVGPRLGMEYV